MKGVHFVPESDPKFFLIWTSLSYAKTTLFLWVGLVSFVQYVIVSLIIAGHSIESPGTPAMMVLEHFKLNIVHTFMNSEDSLEEK